MKIKVNIRKQIINWKDLNNLIKANFEKL